MTTTFDSSTPLNTEDSQNAPVSSTAPVLPSVAVATELTNDIVVPKGMAPTQMGKQRTDDVFCTDLLLDRITISSTNTSQADILSQPYNVWWKYLQNPLVVNRLTGFLCVSGTLKLTFVLNVPGSSAGLYIMSALCDAGVRNYISDFDDVDSDNIWTSTHAPHAFLNAENQKSGTITLPWANPNMAIRKDTGSADFCMWRLLCYPAAPLVSTITTSPITGTISIYARLEPDYQLSSKTYESGVVGAVGKAASAFGEALPSAPKVSSFAKAVGSGLASISSLMDSLGFTRESSPMMPEPSALRFSTSYATVDGFDAGNPVSLMSSNGVTIDPQAVGAGEDEMSFKSLFAKESLVHSITLTPSTPLGVVHWLPVTPSHISPPASGPDPSLSNHHMTTACYVGLPFAYWSGSVRYRIVIPSATNVQGRLQVFWEPDLATTLTLAPDPTIYNEGVMIDLCGSSDTTLEVHMAQPNPLRCNIPCEAAPIPTTLELQSRCNGKLVFFLTSAITAPVSTLPIRVLVFASGSDTTRFHQPRNTVSGSGIGTTYCFSYESAPIPDANKNVIHINMGGPQEVESRFIGESVDSVKAMVQKPAWYAELEVADRDKIYHDPAPDVWSVRASWACVPLPPRLPKAAFNNVTSQLFTYPPGAAASIGVWRPTTEDFNYVQAAGWTYQAWYSAMYAGCRGSTRVKLLKARPHDVTDAEYATNLAVSALTQNDVAAFSGAWGQASSGTGSTVSRFGTGNLIFQHLDVQPLTAFTGGDYVIPYYTPYKFVSTTEMDATVSNIIPITHQAHYASGLGVSLISPLVPSAEAPEPLVRKFSLFVCGGPDFTCVFFRRVPMVTIRQIL